MNLSVISLAIPYGYKCWQWMKIKLFFILFGIVIATNAMTEHYPNDKTLELQMDDVALSSLDGQEKLTLHDAIKRALQKNPELASFAKEISALEGVTIQAGLLPNPSLQIDSEDISVKSNGPGGRFTSVRISQLIETGGKRSARMSAASLGQERAEQAFEVRRLDLIAQVANVFTDVLAGQDRLQLATESLALAQKVVDTVSKRVQSGKVPPIEEMRAKVAYATTKIQFEQARHDLGMARKQLALLWGDPMPHFQQALGDLESFVTIPDFNILSEHLYANPASIGSRLNLEQRKSMLDLEKARRIPDVTFNAGVRRYSPHDTTALIGFSIPIPIFNRNQGNLLEAHQRVDKAEDEWAATDLQLRTLLVQSYEALMAAQNQINMLREEILPGAGEAFTVARRGYELGRFGFLEMLDAQRTLFQNQILYLQALTNYQRLVNEIERLIAQPIDNVSN